MSSRTNYHTGNLSFGRTAVKQTYTVALAVLLLAWFAFTVATIILCIALFIPGHAGLSDLLGALNGLLQSTAVGPTT
jgi:hypothetical protein